MVLVVVGILLPSVPALAIKGYCDANGKPVITSAPPGWEEQVVAVCEGGQLILEAKQEFEKSNGNQGIIPPDDFGRWVNISLNSDTVTNPYGDVRPYIVKSSKRTLVPLRYVSEAFGAKVDWNAEKRQASVDWRGRTIVVPVGKDTAVVNGKEVLLDQPAVLWNSRTMVPLRFLLEAVGATVEWDDVNSFVHITLESAQCPPTYCTR